MKSILIKDTAREERIRIVNQALRGACGIDCEFCLISRDLITWRNLGVCLKPDTFFDNKGAYSGSALVAEDGIYLFYTGNHRDDDWVRTPYTCLAELMDDGSIRKIG